MADSHFFKMVVTMRDKKTEVSQQKKAVFEGLAHFM